MSRRHTDRLIPPVKDVLVSAQVDGDHELINTNRQTLAAMFNNGFTIKNINGTINFSLTDLEEKIVKAAHAFVFLPIPSGEADRHELRLDLIRKMFMAASLFVGMQTKDSNLRLNADNPDSPLKPVVLINHDGCWDPLYKLAHHLHKVGVIKQNPDDIIHLVNNPQAAVSILKQAHDQMLGAVSHAEHAKSYATVIEDKTGRPKPEFNVCVFCSASTKEKQLLDMAENMGSKIASKGWGLVSGMGCTGMMGKVVEGAAKVIQEQIASGVEKQGWIGGSNLRRIINIEGLPEHYDRLWLRGDIYTRMEVMIEQSQAMVVMPGGMGTVQELMAMLLLKHNKKVEGQPYLMNDKKFGNKPIILLNSELRGGKGRFWQPVIEMAKQFGFEKDIIVVNDVKQAIQKLQQHYEKTERKSK